MRCVDLQSNWQLSNFYTRVSLMTIAELVGDIPPLGKQLVFMCLTVVTGCCCCYCCSCWHSKDCEFFGRLFCGRRVRCFLIDSCQSDSCSMQHIVWAIGLLVSWQNSVGSSGPHNTRWRDCCWSLCLLHL